MLRTASSTTALYNKRQSCEKEHERRDEWSDGVGAG